MRARGVVVVISGPSGSGKSSICRRLIQDPRVLFSVSTTTRTPREGELDGREYHFVTPEEFRRHVEGGDFIEHAEVHGNLYGTLRRPMEDAVENGRVFLMEIDVQGALQLKGLGVEGVYIFVAPPDTEDLRARLEGRGTDAPDVIARRLEKARDEMLERDRYDHVVVNDDLERVIAEVRTIIELDEVGE
ncbi:MAG: guanylate kinase [Planctomycetota bacterium]|nr:guanylate kinase [Planctomycetota bacterium]